LGDFCGELADLPRARQGEKQGERVDRKQDARYHAQIAEVRQGVGQVVLPYTLHFCADAKVDACGDVPRASRLRCILQATMAAKPKPGKKLSSGRRENACTPRVRATIRSRPICVCGCAKRSTRSEAYCELCSGDSSIRPKNMPPP